MNNVIEYAKGTRIILDAGGWFICGIGSCSCNTRRKHRPDSRGYGIVPVAEDDWNIVFIYKLDGDKCVKEYSQNRLRDIPDIYRKNKHHFRDILCVKDILTKWIEFKKNE